MTDTLRQLAEAATPLPISPTEALGVALSIPMSSTEMSACQVAAIPMMDHLEAMGFTVVRLDTLAARDQRIAALEEALEDIKRRAQEMKSGNAAQGAVTESADWMAEGMTLIVMMVSAKVDAALAATVTSEEASS